jgi:hypothetical protein
MKPQKEQHDDPDEPVPAVSEFASEVAPSVEQKTLDRLISFRLSEADYQVLLESRKEMNVRTVSQAAREMVCAFLHDGESIRKLALAGSLRKIEGDIIELTGKLRKLTAQW